MGSVRGLHYFLYYYFLFVSRDLRSDCDCDSPGNAMLDLDILRWVCLGVIELQDGLEYIIQQQKCLDNSLDSILSISIPHTAQAHQLRYNTCKHMNGAPCV